jgi:hypothetical protein
MKPRGLKGDAYCTLTVLQAKQTHTHAGVAGRRQEKGVGKGQKQERLMSMHVAASRAAFVLRATAGDAAVVHHPPITLFPPVQGLLVRHAQPTR